MENVEAVVDAATNDEVLKNIPVVGTAVKLVKAAGDIRDKIFAAKLTRFLQALDKTTPEAREKIRQKIAASPEEARGVGETLLLVLDKITALEKAEIIAYVFIAYTLGHIGPTDFLRLSDAVDHAFVDDLAWLVSTRGQQVSTDQNPAAQLSRTGLTMPNLSETYIDAKDLYYSVSAVGERFLNAYLFGKEHCREGANTRK